MKYVGRLIVTRKCCCNSKKLLFEILMLCTLKLTKYKLGRNSKRNRIGLLDYLSGHYSEKKLKKNVKPVNCSYNFRKFQKSFGGLKDLYISRSKSTSTEIEGILRQTILTMLFNMLIIYRRKNCRKKFITLTHHLSIL